MTGEICTKSGYLLSTRLRMEKQLCRILAYHILECGGYFGEGPYTATGYMRIYKTWESMLRRAYTHERDDVCKAYINVTLDTVWLNFQVFADWYVNYMSRLNPSYHNMLQIDKDIIQWHMENKIYSPSTCCLIPGRLNGMLANCNSKADIVSQADFYYKDNAITEDIYNTILNLDI